jgi:UDP-N-acetylmuramate dehydrogenase
MNQIQKNISLAQYTTFKIGGTAKYFFAANNTDDLVRAVEFVKNKQLPYFILGGGSNLLVSDDGFNGLVMLMNNEGRTVSNNIIFAEAGTRLSDLVKISTKAGLSGLEWAAGIPRATLGGAIRGNAGAFGFNISDLVKQVKVLKENLEIVDYQVQDCCFNYRDSIFKRSFIRSPTPNELGVGLLNSLLNSDIILSAKLELKQGNQEKSQRIIKEYLRQRKEKQPLESFSAGSVFKNPSNQSAGYLIEQSGLKGKKVGQAMVSEKHANFIINLGGAQAKDVIKLIQLIKRTIKEKFNIDLEEEIQYLGF